MVEETYSLTLWDSPPRITQVEVAAATFAPAAIHDKAVGHVYGSDDSSLPSLGDRLETFGQWPSVASTLYNKLYQISDVDPFVAEYSASAFASLRYSFSTSPFWNSQFTVASQDIVIRRHEYRPVVEAIQDFCRSREISPDITRLILKNVKQIAQLASKSDGWPERRSMLQNATIAVSTGMLHVMLSYAVTSMEIDQQKSTYCVADQDLQLVMGHAVLDFDFCRRHASSILGYERRSVEDWRRMAAANNEPESTCAGWLDD